MIFDAFMFSLSACFIQVFPLTPPDFEGCTSMSISLPYFGETSLELCVKLASLIWS